MDGGDRVCPTRLASCTQPATDDCNMARDDCSADLKIHVQYMIHCTAVMCMYSTHKKVNKSTDGNSSFVEFF